MASSIAIDLIAAARPNFMKIAPLYHALAREINRIVTDAIAELERVRRRREYVHQAQGNPARPPCRRTVRCVRRVMVRLGGQPNEGVVEWLLACPEKDFFVPIESESTDVL